MMVDGIEGKKLSGTKAKKRSDVDFGRRRRRSNLKESKEREKTRDLFLETFS